MTSSYNYSSSCKKCNSSRNSNSLGHKRNSLPSKKPWRDVPKASKMPHSQSSWQRSRNYYVSTTTPLSSNKTMLIPQPKSAQNSQYSSTGVGFHIRNDLYPSTTARYNLYPSQRRAHAPTHTCMSSTIAPIRLPMPLRKHAFIVISTTTSTDNSITTTSTTPHHEHNTTSSAPYQHVHNNFTTTQMHLRTTTEPTQLHPKSRPKKHGGSLGVHLRFTRELLEHSRYQRLTNTPPQNRTIQPYHHLICGSLAALLLHQTHQIAISWLSL